MKVIIAGGRTYQATELDVAFLDSIEDLSEVVSGCARGADAFGESYAEWKNIPIKKFPAQWDKFGRGAGFIRNEEMAQYADAVVLFPGGKGTDHMYKIALRYDLLIYDRRGNT